MSEQPRPAPARTRLWHTLRFRFAVWTAGLLLIVLVGFGTVIYLSMAGSLFASVDEALKLNASQAATVVEVEGGQLDLPDSFLEGRATAELRGRNFVMRVLNPDGGVVRTAGAYPSLPVTGDSLDAARQQVADLSTLTDPASGDAVRLYTAPIIHDGRTVGIYQVGQALTDVQDTLGRLRRALLIGVPALVLVAGWGGYLLAARTLSPIDAITRTAQRISAEDLSARLDLPPTDDEVGRLAATFDGMLARLDAAFRRERQFTADASHELRTPLAAMQTILDVTREKRRTADEYERALGDLADETARLRGLAESLLLLERTNGHRALARELVDLSTLLGDVTDSLRPLAENKGLELSCAAPPGLTVMGDMDGLIRLFANLVDNAIKYTHKGHVAVTARRLPDAGVEIKVTDTGIGIPPEHLPHIFERFYRVEQSRTTDGMGLGLAIAQEIARSHGGRLAVESAVGQGTTLTVALPLSAIR